MEDFSLGFADAAEEINSGPGAHLDMNADEVFLKRWKTGQCMDVNFPCKISKRQIAAANDFLQEKKQS